MSPSIEQRRTGKLLRLQNEAGVSCLARLVCFFSVEEANRGAEDFFTFRRCALALYRLKPRPSRVALVVIGHTPMFLVEIAHQWFDVTAKRISVTRVNS